MAKEKAGNSIAAYVLLAPSIILSTIFVIIPLLYSIRVSFYEWSFYQKSIFVGFRNFYLVLTDPAFFKSILVGLKFAAFVVPVQFIFGFLFAHVLKRIGGALGSFVKTSIYVPTVISGIIASAIFVFIYDYQSGFANAIIGLFGIEGKAWLADQNLALFSLSVPAVWLGFGYIALIMLSGLNDIPAVYYEASDVEGANFIQKMYFITIPNMKNLFLYFFVVGFLGALQQFDLAFMMTKGGPMNETMTPNLLIYNHFVKDPYMGYTVAASLLMFIVLGFISALIFRVINSEKTAD
jgi:multiple sugar transport system permease protein